MKISVITVCHNAGPTIARTLKSVREQTYKNIEHIIVDGGSTDNTLDVISEHGLHVTKVISGRDNGIYEAMNKGIQLATGDVVGFINADDFYDNNAVLARVADLMLVDNLDVLYGNVEFFRPNNLNVVVRTFDSAHFMPHRLGCGWMPAHPALFVRRKLFELHGGFSVEYQIAGDFEFIARIFKNADLNYRHLPLSLVRMQTGGVSTRGWRSALLINQEMMRACRANGISTSWIKLLSRYPLKIAGFFKVFTKM